jgi:hypothetical protein
MNHKKLQGILNDPDVLKAVAQKLAKDGTHGDTILAHIGPAEAALLKARGGVGTPNPRTGLPQFYDQGTDNANLGGGQNDTQTTGGNGGYGGASDGSADRAASGNGPGIMDHMSGYFGQNPTPDANTLGPNPMSAQPNPRDYGGFLGSNGLRDGVGLAASVAGGPLAGMAARGAVGMMQGRNARDTATGAFGDSIGTLMDHGVNGPPSPNAPSNGGNDPLATPMPLNVTPMDQGPLSALSGPVAVASAYKTPFAPMARAV